MNAPAPRVSVKNNEMLEDQLQAWGVTPAELSPELIDYTTHVLAASNKRIGDIVAEFGFATRAEIEKHASTKPVNVLTLDHLSEHIDNLRPHTQKLLAANDKLAYYESLANAPIHPDFKTSTALRAFCQEHNCLPLLSNSDSTLRLIFADYATQKEYAQRSRIQRVNDAISQLRHANGFINLIFGIGQREQIATHLHSESNEAIETVDDEDRINFWSENNANTKNQKLLARILTLATEKKASNIKFTPNHNGTVDVFYRRHGSLRAIPNIRSLSVQQADEINRFLHTKSVARHTDTGKRVEGRLLSSADGQFVYSTTTSETFMRCSYIPVANNGLAYTLESISIRLLPRDAISIKLDELHVSPALIAIANSHLMQSHGLILVVGPTSSGKSTTIAGMISLYRDTFGNTKNLVSLEQPVERHLQGITQFDVRQSKFESGMAALLRHDPNFIWVGELRDRPSASTCIRAANTGNIVVSTLHADDCPTAYNALLSYISNNTGTSADSVIVTQYDAISALSLIVAQRLVPTLCPHCKRSITGDGTKIYSAKLRAYEEYCQRNGYKPKEIGNTYLRNPAGCDKCDFEGYIGEIPINEILPITRDLRRQLISMANDNKNDLEILAKNRPYTLFDEAMRLVLEGTIAIDNALI